MTLRVKVFIFTAEQDVVVGQRVDQVGQQARRHGDRALVCDLRADPAGDAQLQVGGRQAQAALIGGEQDVAEHRQGAARRNGPRNHAQSMRQLLL